VVAENARLDDFPGEGGGDKNDPFPVSTDPFSEIGEGIDFQLEFLVILEGDGMESGRGPGHGIERARPT
jgi:hypothetical protein